MTNGDDTPPRGADGESAHPIDDRGFFGHPKGLAVLFFAELWERFSFYGMRALLVLYMYQELGMPKSTRAYAIYGAYGALVYAFPVIGGWVANQWLGYRRTVVLGGAFMALGHFAMALEELFFPALALLCVGNGFFKPNISSTVGRLYEEGDRRRDGGFTIFYMGINIGAAVAPIVCGTVGQKVSYHWGFALAGFGMVLGLIWYLVGQRHLGTHAEADRPELLEKPVILGLRPYPLVVLGGVVTVPVAAFLLHQTHLAEIVVQAVSVLVLGALIVFAVQLEGVARYRLIALIVLMFFHMLFWAAFEQAGSSLTVLTEEHVRRSALGVELEASNFQFFNPLFIVLLGPAFTALWKTLHRSRTEPSIPMKFALGLVQLGLGYLVLVWGFAAADSLATIAMGWVVLCYLLHTTGELCLSPVGLSAVTKLAPKKWVGLCMGAWFLTIANAHLFAAAIAALTSGDDSPTPVAAKAFDPPPEEKQDAILLGLGPKEEKDEKSIPEIAAASDVSAGSIAGWEPARAIILTQIRPFEAEKGDEPAKAERTIVDVAERHGITPQDILAWPGTRAAVLSAVAKGVPEKVSADDARESWDSIGQRWSVGREKILEWRAKSLANYHDAYEAVGWVAIAAGVFLALLTPFLKKLLIGVE